MANNHGIDIRKAVLHGSYHTVSQRQPLLRGNLPESVAEAIEVPTSLAGFENEDEIRILYVDDDAELTELTKIYLEQESEEFTVTTTTNAVAALEKVQNGDFDCLISDYDMPNTDGIDLLKIVRETHPNLPFILFTAKGAESVASEAFSAGATDYMQKEIGEGQYEMLANRVHSAVEQYRMQQYFWNALSWYQTLVEQNFAGVFIVQDGEFLFVNQKLADMLGYYQSDLIGTVPTALASSPEDRTKLETLLEFDRHPNGAFHIEVTVSSRTGEEVPVEIQGGTIQHDGECGCIGLFWEKHRENSR